MAVTPDDNELTYNGATLGDTGKVLLLACGALAREVLAVRDANGWTHLDVTCLPAILHNTPERIPNAVTEAVTKHHDYYDRIYVLYADCGTGGLLEAQCKRLGVQMMRGPHCYSFFEGNEAFAAREEFTAFYLTDFLVRQFDAFVWKPLGLDRHPSLRDMYFGNYEKLVYQAQTDDPALTAKAQECADRLNLPLERRFTGYGDLETEMKAFAAD